MIPSGQYWEGNPVKFVREVTEKEMYQTYITAYENFVEKEEQIKDAENEKLNITRKEQVNDYVSENYFKWRAKYYDH